MRNWLRIFVRVFWIMCMVYTGSDIAELYLDHRGQGIVFFILIVLTIQVSIYGTDVPEKATLYKEKEC